MTRRVIEIELAWKVMTIPSRHRAPTDTARLHILDAAIEAFATRGFAATTMTDVMATSGANIAGIYHHFGGKRELFFAVFDQLAADVDRHIAQTADSGADSRDGFEAGARAYLEAMWIHRRAAAPLASDDIPAGFDGLRRSSLLDILQRWAPALGLDVMPEGELLTRAVGAILAEASALVVLCDDRADATLISDATIEAVDRLLR